MDTFKLIEGSIPLVISMPHNGFEIPEDIAACMTQNARKSPDTDWFVDRLYDFAPELGCYQMIPRYSRYVVDLNRSPFDESLYPGQDVTGLCPTSQFNRQPIYKDGYLPDSTEIQRRVKMYWQPYHQSLQALIARLKESFGYVILFEAHSIASKVPRFFNGKLTDFNFGTNDKNSCSNQISKVIDDFVPEGYSKVINGRFKGGYITRQYGDPAEHIDSLQLELSQATYMNEEGLSYNAEKAANVKKQLYRLIEMLTDQIKADH